MALQYLEVAVGVANSLPDLCVNECTTSLEVYRSNCVYTLGSNSVKKPVSLTVTDTGICVVKVFENVVKQVEKPSEAELTQLVRCVSFYGSRHVLCPGFQNKITNVKCEEHALPFVHYRSRGCCFWTGKEKGSSGRGRNVHAVFELCTSCSSLHSQDRSKAKKAPKLEKAGVDREIEPPSSDLTVNPQKDRKRTSSSNCEMDTANQKVSKVESSVLSVSLLAETNLSEFADVNEGVDSDESKKSGVELTTTLAEGDGGPGHVISADNGLPPIPDFELVKVEPVNEDETTGVGTDSVLTESSVVSRSVSAPDICAEPSKPKEKRKPRSDQAGYCTLCKRDFADIRNHKSTVHRGGAPPRFVCSKCGCGFSRESALRTHTHETHGLDVFECECGWKLASREALEIHKKSHDMKQFQKFEPKCDVCAKSFRAPNLLRKHRFEVHNVGEPLMCKLCFMSFKNDSVLLLHIKRSHREEETEPFPCIVSKASEPSDSLDPMSVDLDSDSSDPVSARSSAAVLSNQKQGPTPIKKTTVVIPSNANSGASRTYPSVKGKPSAIESKEVESGVTVKKEPGERSLDRTTAPDSFAFVTCSKTSPTRETSEEYKIGIHGKLQYHCNICSQLFRTEANFRYHMLRLHPNESPYACLECGATFKRRQDLTTHSVMHEELHQCDCGWRTTSRPVLEIHKLNCIGNKNQKPPLYYLQYDISDDKCSWAT